jgi:CRISPR-associated protein Cmr2
VNQHIHVSIGPVQSFVAQSRRTRDLWGSSYLLSFLATHAMKGTRRAGGTIIRPRVDDDPMLRWVESNGGGEAPRLGSVPNQFTAEIAHVVDAGPVASAAEKALRDAWLKVCGAVWDRYVTHAASAGNGTKAIWDRQVGGFWEVIWVAGTPEDHGLLARRKLWRTHWLPEEGGNKCTIMPELQEISGHVRATDRARQDAFWSAMRTRTGDLDLRDNERLSAVALVKRLYPRVAQKALGFALDVTHWPSTVDVAAVPWLQQLRAVAGQDAAAYADAVAKASDRALTGGVSSLLNQAQGGAPRFLRLDANWFQRSFVASSKLAPLSDEGARASVLARLDSLTAARDGAGLGSPAVYFALLLADGDRVGQMVASAGSDVVSSALAKFTRAVRDIVKGRHGVTVYAGGDDVLALLPLESALDCAREMERAYRQSFGSAPATLSAAVVFAHARDPLNRILAEAHRLLDEVAKEENRRASLAAGVYRGGAAAVQWATTWERSSIAGTRKDAVECLHGLSRELASERGRLSGSLLQDLRQMLGILCGASPLAPGSFARFGEGVDMRALVRAEIEHRLGHHDGASRPGDAERLAALVDDVLGRSRNGETASSHVGIDGLLLASFLAGGGRGEEHGP